MVPDLSHFGSGTKMRTVGLKQMRTHGLKNADMVLKKLCCLHHGWADRRSVIGPVRYGPKIFRTIGPWLVRGPKIWSEIIWSGPWSENLVRSYLVRSVVRKIGPNLFGPVRGPWFLRTNLVRTTYLVRSGTFFEYTFWIEKKNYFQKKILAENPDQTDFGPTNLVRNWSGTDFFPQ